MACRHARLAVPAEDLAAWLMRNGRMAYGHVLLPDAILGVEADRHEREEMEMRASIAVENSCRAYRDRIAGAVQSAGGVLLVVRRRCSLALLLYPTSVAAEEGGV